MKIDGINVHIDNSNTLKVSQLGCEWVRIDINWWEIEKSNNSFNWGQIDSIVNHYSSKFKIYATLMGTPKWHKGSFNEPPDPTIWARFCANCAKRYQGKIAVYSLWNEPNLGKTFWKGSIKQFFQTIVAPGAQAIKTVNPNLQVAAADFATTSSSKWPSWLDEFKHHLKNVDIVSIHTYKDTAGEVKRSFTIGQFPIIGWIIPKYRPYNHYLKRLKRPVFLTEVGLEAKYGNTRQMKEQAKFVKEVQDNKKDMDVEKIFFYCLFDADKNLEKPFGFYSIKGEPKTVVFA